MLVQRPRFDLLGYVETLHEKSTIHEINKALYYDFKKESIGYYEQVIEDKVLKQKISNRIAKYQYIEEDDQHLGNNSHPGLNWLRYAITNEIVKEELAAEYGHKYYMKVKTFDCDSSNGSCTLTEEVYQKLWPDDKDAYGGDTINSYWNTYKIAMTLYHPFQKILKRDITTLSERIETFYRSNGVAQDEQLAQFATLTHTIGNFMRCPKGRPSYNLSKGDIKHISDYPDMMFLWLNNKIEGEIIVRGEKVSNERKELWNEWINQRKSSYFLDVYYNTDDPIFLFARTPKKSGGIEIYPQNQEQLSEYLRLTNAVIEIRGIKILMALNPKLHHNDFLLHRFKMLEKLLSKHVRDFSVHCSDAAIKNERNVSELQNKYFMINDSMKATRNPIIKIKNASDRVKDMLVTTIRSFNKNPFYCGSQLSIYSANLLAITMFIIATISLFVGGHFKQQIEIIKNNGFMPFFESINESATSSVAILVYFNKYVFLVIALLLLVAFVGLYVDCITNSRKVKSITMIITATITAILIAIPVAINLFSNYINNLYWNDKLFENSTRVEIYKKIMLLTEDNTILIVYGIICLSLISLIVLFLYYSHVSRLTIKLLLSLSIIYIGTPVLLWFIENIIFLTILLVLTTFVWIFLKLINRNENTDNKRSGSYD